MIPRDPFDLAEAMGDYGAVGCAPAASRHRATQASPRAGFRLGHAVRVTWRDWKGLAIVSLLVGLVIMLPGCGALSSSDGVCARIADGKQYHAKAWADYQLSYWEYADENGIPRRIDGKNSDAWRCEASS